MQFWIFMAVPRYSISLIRVFGDFFHNPLSSLLWHFFENTTIFIIIILCANFG